MLALFALASPPGLREHGCSRRMPVLPIILEQSARWYVFAGPLAGVLLVVSGGALWFAWRRGLANSKSSTLVALLATVAIATWALILPLGWELRLDRDGISLKAPFDPAAESGRIAWKDLKEIRFGTHNSVAAVEFVSGRGQVVVLDTLQQVPPSFWPTLITVVEANAPAYQFRPSAADWLDRAHKASQPVESAWMLQGYVARDGAGNELK